jgi:hypothetical protein
MLHATAALPPKGTAAASNSRETCTADHLPPLAAGMPAPGIGSNLAFTRKRTNPDVLGDQRPLSKCGVNHVQPFSSEFRILSTVAAVFLEARVLHRAHPDSCYDEGTMQATSRAESNSCAPQ